MYALSCIIVFLLVTVAVWAFILLGLNMFLYPWLFGFQGGGALFCLLVLKLCWWCCSTSANLHFNEYRSRNERCRLGRISRNSNTSWVHPCLTTCNHHTCQVNECCNLIQQNLSLSFLCVQIFLIRISFLWFQLNYFVSKKNLKLIFYCVCACCNYWNIIAIIFPN